MACRQYSRTAPWIGRLILLLGVTALSADPARAAGCSEGVPCTAPTQAQADRLFGKLEALYPLYLSPVTTTVSQPVAGQDAWVRVYDNAYGAGLAAYQGKLWFRAQGNWYSLMSLDAADGAYCQHQCWLATPVTTPAFTLAQTLSDQAQKTTLAFAGLAMVTGNLAAQSFFPPGKVADYTGFQYLRDNDPDNMGHNTDFLTRVANNVILALDDSQFALLRALAVAQTDLVARYGYQRYSLMAAFRRQLTGDIPAGSSGLNQAAVAAASAQLYRLDGQISTARAVLYAQIIQGLSVSQRARLDAMKGKGFNSWPAVTDAMVAARMKTLPPGTAAAVMTFASDIYSWYAGSLEADVYFCPERHGTYFGSFYMKDAPAVGHAGYSIDEQLTASAGLLLADAGQGYVSADQAALFNSLIDTQRSNLAAMVTVRTQIAVLLRSLLNVGTDGAQLDNKLANELASQVATQVDALSATYGALDGANNYAYATTFARLQASFSDAQKARLAAVRKSILSGRYADGTTFDDTVATRPYLYADPITDTTVLSPYVAAATALFFPPASADQ